MTYEALETAAIVKCIMQSIKSRTQQESDHVLFQCMQVNRLWFNEAASVLYEHSYLEILDRFEDPERRKFYAGLIESLLVYGDRTTHEYLTAFENDGGNLELTAMTILTFYNFNHEEDALKQFFLPGLKEFAMLGETIPSELLYELSAKCPELKYFLTQGKITGTANYLANLNTSNVVIYEEPLDPQYMSPAFFEAASNAKIVDLSVGHIDDHGILKVMRRVKVPFKGLKRLMCYMGNFTVSALLSVVPNLTQLSILGCIDADETLLALTDHGVGLEKVDLTAFDGTPRANTLVKFAERHCELKVLRVKMTDAKNDQFPAASLQFLEKLPLLEDLGLKFNWIVTAVALVKIGECCPNLETLTLESFQQATGIPGNSLLVNHTPLFLKVTELEPLDKFERIGEQMLTKHFPLVKLGKRELRSNDSNLELFFQRHQSVLK